MTKEDVWLAVYRDELNRLTKDGNNYDESDVRGEVIAAANAAADAYEKKFTCPACGRHVSREGHAIGCPEYR